MNYEKQTITIKKHHNINTLNTEFHVSIRDIDVLSYNYCD